MYSGKPAVTLPSLLKRPFDVVEPNKVWGTDIIQRRNLTINQSTIST
ncbi:ISPsy26, transposase orfB [Pseudomonas sp. FH4]|jgi:hypothetical protein|nr:ISPsy26, transposase orfB [Pseudomonas sp. FH4]